MDETSQWGIAALIGTSFAAFLAWFNKSDSDLINGFEPKNQKYEKKKKRIASIRKSKRLIHIPIRTQ